jgi:hypothetical protein
MAGFIGFGQNFSILGEGLRPPLISQLLFFQGIIVLCNAANRTLLDLSAEVALDPGG